MPFAVVVIGIIFGLCLLGTALGNMSSPLAFLVIVLVMFLIVGLLELIDKKKKTRKIRNFSSVGQSIRLITERS